MNAHTPGPWKALRDHDRETIVSDHVNAYGNFIVTIVTRGDETMTDEDRANSALIASSPELLEACILAERAMGGEAMEFDSPEHALFTAKQALRKAIAQARGEE